MSCLLSLALLAQQDLDSVIDRLRSEDTRAAAAEELLELALEKDLRKPLAARRNLLHGKAAEALTRVLRISEYRWSLRPDLAGILRDEPGFPALYDTITGGSGKEAEALLQRLSALAGTELIPLLHEIGKDARDEIRPALLLLQGLCGDRGALGPLTELTTLKSPVALQAAGVLGTLAEKRDLPLLRSLLDDPGSARVIWPVVERLDRESLRGPAKKYLDAESEGLRFLAARSLALLGDRSGLPVLIERLNANPDRLEIRLIVNAMKHLKPVEAVGVFKRLAESPDPAKVRLGLEGLVAAGPEHAVPELIRALGHADQRNVAAFAIERLKEIHHGWWLGPARRNLSSPLAEMRANAAHLLGLAGDSDSVDDLAGLLEDRSPYVRYRALQSLYRIDPERAAREIGSRFEKGIADPYVRSLAAEVLAKHDPSRAESVFRRLAASTEPFPACLGLQKLAAIGPDDVLNLARKALARSNPGVRLIALRILFEHGAPDALDRLLENFAGLEELAPRAWLLIERHATDPAYTDRFARVAGDTGAPETLRLLAAGWLGHYGGGERVLLDLLKDDSDHVRLVAAAALARRGRTEEARAVLVEFVGRKEFSNSRDLFESLARCGGEDVIRRLKGLGENPLALEALARLDGVDAPAFHPAVLSSRLRVRDVALFGLARRGNEWARKRLHERARQLVRRPDRGLPEVLVYTADTGGSGIVEHALATLAVEHRVRIIQALGRWSTPEHIELIRTRLDDRAGIAGRPELENGVREVALNTLVRMTRHPVQGTLEERIRRWREWWEGRDRSPERRR